MQIYLQKNVTVNKIEDPPPLDNQRIKQASSRSLSLSFYLKTIKKIKISFVFDFTYFFVLF